MRVRRRIFPVLTIKDGGLVKTSRFTAPKYLGDPINAVRIFNEKEVDELIFLDISKDRGKTGPDFELLQRIVDEAFMPLTYGGGISSVEDAYRLIKMGFEKILVNSLFYDEPNVLENIVKHLGSQSVVVSIDYRKKFGKTIFYKNSGRHKINESLERLMDRIRLLEIGEVVLHSIDRDGTRMGYDIEMLKIASVMSESPMIALGGAKDINDIRKAFADSQISAVAAGHLFVFYGKLNGVLINFPQQDELYDEVSN